MPAQGAVCKTVSWQPGGRRRLLEQLKQESQQQEKPVWDIVIVGGGITGAGLLRESRRLGLKALLLEKNDFAYGSSSKSSKMVHGGLRYIASGDLTLTRDSVRERRRLLGEAPGLVDPLVFLMGHYEKQFPPGFIFDRVLDVYDLFAGKRQHRRYPAREAVSLAPGIRQQGLKSISEFADAVTDDARLVLRLLRESVEDGGLALNYCNVLNVSRIDNRSGSAETLQLVRFQDCSDSSFTGDENAALAYQLPQDERSDTVEVLARVVINATGAWADELPSKRENGDQQTVQPRMRPLRGSHLVIPGWRFPVGYSVSYFHPRDRRPVFIFPWEGTTVIGTTDLDHDQPMDQDAAISVEEVNYLLEGVNHQFPGLHLSTADVISTWSGLRPVVASGALDPSSEKREHSIWDDQGLITVAGGKLTTFRLIALDVLQKAEPYLDGLKAEQLNRRGDNLRVFEMTPDVSELPVFRGAAAQRMSGRYGKDALSIQSAIVAGEYAEWAPDAVGSTRFMWAELHWCLQNETVVHLDDLLLRRTRIGSLLPAGGQSVLPRVRELCMTTLGWSEQQWEREEARYLDIIQRYFSLPEEMAG